MNDQEKALRDNWRAIVHEAAVVGSSQGVLPLPLRRRADELFDAVLGVHVAPSTTCANCLLPVAEVDAETGECRACYSRGVAPSPDAPATCDRHAKGATCVCRVHTSPFDCASPDAPGLAAVILAAYHASTSPTAEGMADKVAAAVRAALAASGDTPRDGLDVERVDDLWREWKGAVVAEMETDGYRAAMSFRDYLVREYASESPKEPTR